MATIQEKITAALKARGYSLMESRGRYDMWKRPDTMQTVSRLYIGTSGSIRTGRTRASSIPINETVKKELIAEGELLLIENGSIRKYNTL